MLQNDGASDGALAASPTQPKSKKSVKHKEPPQQEQEVPYKSKLPRRGIAPKVHIRRLPESMQHT